MIVSYKAKHLLAAVTVTSELKLNVTAVNSKHQSYKDNCTEINVLNFGTIWNENIRSFLSNQVGGAVTFTITYVKLTGVISKNLGWGEWAGSKIF